MSVPDPIGPVLDPADYRRGFGVSSLVIRVLLYVAAAATAAALRVAKRLAPTPAQRPTIHDLMDAVKKAEKERIFRRVDQTGQFLIRPVPVEESGDFANTAARALRDKDRSLRYYTTGQQFHDMEDDDG